MKTWPSPQPGDFACVPISGDLGKLVGLGEKWCGDGFAQYQHAFIYVGDGKIVEAEPGGARLIALPRQYEPWSAGVTWSTGRFATLAQRDAIVAAAKGFIGVPYSFLDYTALAAHRLRIPAPGLLHYIASSRHMICSQLVDYAYMRAGVHLFSDGRWPGYVTPSDLAGVIAAPAGVTVDED